jgi:hypothetical protein
VHRSQRPLAREHGDTRTDHSQPTVFPPAPMFPPRPTQVIREVIAGSRSVPPTA